MEIHFEKVRFIYTLEFGNDLFWLENMKQICKFLIWCALNTFFYCVGKSLKWVIPNDGGHVTNLSSFIVVCYIQVFIKCDNQGPCIDEHFVASK